MTQAYKAAFENAGCEVQNDQGQTATVKFESRHDYFPFRLPENSPAVLRTKKAIESLGWTPTLKIGNGGLDANWLVRHGIPTITVGAGQNQIHTVEEFVELADFERGCQVVLALATM
ncbi:MAG: M20/M25/M40 family metallo-hydrolase [Gemmataceae bacterium]